MTEPFSSYSGGKYEFFLGKYEFSHFFHRWGGQIGISLSYGQDNNTCRPHAKFGLIPRYTDRVLYDFSILHGKNVKNALYLAACCARNARAC